MKPPTCEHCDGPLRLVTLCIHAHYADVHPDGAIEFTQDEVDCVWVPDLAIRPLYLPQDATTEWLECKACGETGIDTRCYVELNKDQTAITGYFDPRWCEWVRVPNTVEVS